MCFVLSANELWCLIVQHRACWLYFKQLEVPAFPGCISQRQMGHRKAGYSHLHLPRFDVALGNVISTQPWETSSQRCLWVCRELKRHGFSFLIKQVQTQLFCLPVYEKGDSQSQILGLGVHTVSVSTTVTMIKTPRSNWGNHVRLNA